MKKCNFDILKEIEKPEDIPYSLPDGSPNDFLFEFYNKIAMIFKENDILDRYEICKNKAEELGKELFS